MADREDFFRTQFLFWLLCAVDGHAKNFSVFLEAGGGFRLIPRYDVPSAYPYLGAAQQNLSLHRVKMAMAVVGQNRHYKWKEIQARLWLETARLCGLGARGRTLLEEVVESTSNVIKQVESKLPSDIPGEMVEPIFTGLRESTARAKEQLRKYAAPQKKRRSRGFFRRTASLVTPVYASQPMYGSTSHVASFDVFPTCVA